MPTYEYRCEGCGAESEVFQSIKDAALRRCEACGKNALKRLISGGGAILFKGSGFYETDYRSQSYQKAAEAEKAAASPAESKKTEAKPQDPSSAGSTTAGSTPAASGSSVSASPPERTRAGVTTESTSSSKSGAKSGAKAGAKAGTKRPADPKPAGGRGRSTKRP